LEAILEDFDRCGMSTARGCLSTALSSIDLADEYVAKFLLEQDQ
jgi:hypothetical protein